MTRDEAEAIAVAVGAGIKKALEQKANAPQKKGRAPSAKKLTQEIELEVFEALSHPNFDDLDADEIESKLSDLESSIREREDEILTLARRCEKLETRLGQVVDYLRPK